MKSAVLERLRSELAACVPDGAALPERRDLAAMVEAAREAGASQDAVARAVAKAFDLEFVDSLVSYTPSAEFLNAIPIAFARQHRLLGFGGEQGRLILVLGDAAGFEQAQVVSRFLNRPVTL